MAQHLDRVAIARQLLARGVTGIHPPPHWAVVRNLSDPIINGELPAKELHLDQQTTAAAGYSTACGKWTSITRRADRVGDRGRPVGRR